MLQGEEIEDDSLSPFFDDYAQFDFGESSRGSVDISEANEVSGADTEYSSSSEELLKNGRKQFDSLVSQYGAQKASEMEGAFRSFYNGARNGLSYEQIKGVSSEISQNVPEAVLRSAFFAGQNDATLESERARKKEAREKREQKKGKKNTDVHNGKSVQKKFAIVSLGDGKKYVQATEKVIKSENPEDWEMEIINYVNDVVRGGTDVEITLDNGEVLKITGRTAWKLGYRNTENGVPISDEIYLVKGNAAGVIDEIVSVSNLRKTKPLLKKRKGDFAKNGFDYRRAYFRDLDGGYYELKISVGINQDGKEVYNIGDITKKEMPKSVTGSKAVNDSKVKTDNKASHNKSITHKKALVNSNYMQNGENNTPAYDASGDERLGYSREKPNAAVENFAVRMNKGFKASGLSITTEVYYDSSKDAVRGEWIFDGEKTVIRLNGALLRGATAASWAMSHELFHEGAKNDSSLVSLTLSAFERCGLYDGSSFETYKAAYEAAHGKVLSREFIEEEIAADLMFRILGKKELCEMFAAKADKGLLSKLSKFFRGFAKRLHLNFDNSRANRYSSDILLVAQLFEKAVKNEGNIKSSVGTQTKKNALSGNGDGLTKGESIGKINNNITDGGANDGDTGRNAETLRVRGKNYHVYKSETSNRGSGENSTQYNEKKIRYQGLSAYEKGRLSEILYPVVEEAEDFKPALKGVKISEATARLCEIIDTEPNSLQYMIEQIPGFADAVEESIRFVTRDKGVPQGKKTVSGDASPSGAYDSNGNELSKAQNEMFEDSKVRDKDGNLLVLYHGSRFSDVHEFDIYKGIWLTPNIEYARSFSDFENDNLHSLYANIVTPLDIGQIDGVLTTHKIGELADALGYDEQTLFVAAKPYIGRRTFDFTRTHQFIELARKAGFDGMVAREGDIDTYCVIERANQVKEVTNKVPTYSGDSRFALSGKSNASEQRKFTYDALTSLPDMEVPFIGSDTNIKYTADGRIDKGYIFKVVRDKCEAVTTNKREPTYVTDVPALGGKVEVTGKSITHGFINGLKKNSVPTASAEITARAELMLPEILKNSIEVNRKDGRDTKTDYSSVLLGVVGIENVNGDTEYYAVRSVVEMGKNKTPALIEYGVVGTLYASNAKKQTEIKGWVADNTASRPTRRLSKVSISQLLDSVKGVFDDTLSNDVYEHFGVKRRESDFSKELRFALSGKGTPGELLPSVRDKLSEKLSELSIELKVEKGNVRAFKKDVLDITEQIANDGVVSDEAQETLARVLYEYSTEEAGADEYEERLRDAASRINRTRLYVSPRVRSDVADYNDFARHFGVGKLTSDENNISVDRFFSELADDFPELGLDKSSVLGDKLHALKDIKDRAREISARSNVPLAEIMDFNSVRDDFISLAQEVLDEARELSGYALPLQSDIDAANAEEMELRKNSPVIRAVERNAAGDLLSTAKTEKEFGEDAEALLSYIEKSYKKDSPEYSLAKAITEFEKDRRFVGKKMKSVIDAFKIKAFKADRAKAGKLAERFAENLGFDNKLSDVSSFKTTLFSFYEMMEDFIAGKTSSQEVVSAARAIAEGVVEIRGVAKENEESSGYNDKMTDVSDGESLSITTASSDSILQKGNSVKGKNNALSENLAAKLISCYLQSGKIDTKSSVPSLATLTEKVFSCEEEISKIRESIPDKSAGELSAQGNKHKKENRSLNKDASPNESGNTYARPVPYISIADLSRLVNNKIGSCKAPILTAHQSAPARQSTVCTDFVICQSFIKIYNGKQNNPILL